MAQRRHFGHLQRERSGRYRASFIDPYTRRRVYGPATFATKADANQWLSTVQTDVARGDHLDPAGNDILFEEFAKEWLADKRALRPKTVELYSYLLNCHLLPTFGPLPLVRIDTTLVRRWHAATLSGHLSQSTVAKTYRLLRQILETAIDDHLLRQNPCRLKGAATEKTIERAIPTLAQVHALADAIDPRYRAMVWLGALGGLRKGECHGLARRHVIDDGTTVSVRVERALVETQRHGLLIQEPKTEAGRRTVTLPSFAAEEVRIHLERFVGADPEGPDFHRGARRWSGEQDGVAQRMGEGSARRRRRLHLSRPTPLRRHDERCCWCNNKGSDGPTRSRVA